eukprot:TRINITY_DN23222_c0_g1_i1.p1 TRINITY_DN23222_c0_g1~~TRINITY_DN23222_c0_g1_i1.p1  ORF type:complete len:577 (+),score=159.93 TRINITY_DN23222_c0_g1_i1:52-1731(+)
MGVQGFKRLLQDRYGKAVQMTQVRKARVEMDHVYVDINSILHGCVSNKEVEATMKDILETLDVLFEVLSPQTTLFLAIDGPAPFAKIPLQRGRRRQAALTTKPTTLITKLDLTPGTIFMEKLTDSLVTWAATVMENSTVTVVVSGSGVPGEGESKIFQAIGSLAANNPATEETFCIVGNDTDLVLGCLCMTHAINLTILDSQTGFTVSLPDLLGTWLCDPPNPNPTHAKDFVSNTAVLPAARVGFAFVANFAGNDYIPALEGIDSFNVWTAYAKLIGKGKAGAIIDMAKFQLNHEVLALVLTTAMQDMGRSAPTGREDTESVPAYLQGLMWTMAGLCGQGCTDYGYVYPRKWAGPHVNAVITWCKGKRKVGAPHGKVAPLPPMKYLACVLPLEAWWMLPEKLLNMVEKDAGKKRKRQPEEVALAVTTLEASSEAQDVVDSVETLFGMVEIKSSRLSLQSPYTIKLLPAGSEPGTKAKHATGIRATAKQWGSVSVTKTPSAPQAPPALPMRQPETPVTLYNPFTLQKAELPAPTGGAKGKTKAKKTGINLSSAVQLDIEC